MFARSSGHDGGTVGSARVILGAVAPVRALEDAERALAGQPLNEQTATAAAEAAVRTARR